MRNSDWTACFSLVFIQFEQYARVSLKGSRRPSLAATRNQTGVRGVCVCGTNSVFHGSTVCHIAWRAQRCLRRIGGDRGHRLFVYEQNETEAIGWTGGVALHDDSDRHEQLRPSDHSSAIMKLTDRRKLPSPDHRRESPRLTVGHFIRPAARRRIVYWSLVIFICWRNRRV